MSFGPCLSRSFSFLSPQLGMSSVSDECEYDPCDFDDKADVYKP